MPEFSTGHHQLINRGEIEEIAESSAIPQAWNLRAMTIDTPESTGAIP